MTPCLPFSHAALLIYGIIAAAVVLLIVAYLISVVRKARLGEACLATYADSYEVAYEELHRTEQQNARLDELLSRGMKEIEFRERRASYNDEGVQ